MNVDLDFPGPKDLWGVFWQRRLTEENRQNINNFLHSCKRVRLLTAT